MSKKMIRIVALVLAILMIGGVCAAALNVFALDPAAAIVATGDRTNTTPIIIALVCAVLLIAVCIILPKLKKK